MVKKIIQKVTCKKNKIIKISKKHQDKFKNGEHVYIEKIEESEDE